MEKYIVSIFNIAASMGKIADLVDKKLTGHHRRVAYIAGRLAEALNLSLEEQDEIILASLVHDIGGISTKERLEDIDSYNESEHHHAESGYKLLSLFKPLNQTREIIKYHHVCFKESIGI